MMTLQELIDEIAFELDAAPDFEDWDAPGATWDDWLIVNADRFRNLIGELIMWCEAGIYFVVDQQRSLALLDVTATVEDGPRGLLNEWMRQARETVAERQAVPA